MTLAKKDTAEISKHPKRARVDISVYERRIRISPSIYNDQADIDKLLDALA